MAGLRFAATIVPRREEEGQAGNRVDLAHRRIAGNRGTNTRLASGALSPTMPT